MNLINNQAHLYKTDELDFSITYILKTNHTNSPKTGFKLKIKDILYHLSSSCDIWQAFIQAKELDKSFYGWNWQLLGFLSYSVGFMQLARKARQSKRLLIHLDDPLESTIINEASRLQKNARVKLGFEVNETIVGLYLLQHQVIPNKNIDSNFYTSIISQLVERTRIELAGKP